MRQLTIGLLLVAILIAYPAIDWLEMQGESGRYQSTVWLIIAVIEVPLLVMLALQFVKDSPRAVAATAAIAFVGFAALLPFAALMILLSAMDFMNDGKRWGLVCTLAVLVLATGVVSRRRYREEPAEGAGWVWSAPIWMSAAYVLLTYIAIYISASKPVG